MYSRTRAMRILSLLIIGWLGFCPGAMSQSNRSAATLQRVDVLHSGKNFELEMEASRSITPQAQVVTGPDRLVIDFPDTVPGPRLHPIAVKAGDVRMVRMGLFQASPPVARVVVDLNSPPQYEIFPSGKSVIVKIGAGVKMAAVSSSAVPSAPIAATSPAPPPAQPVPAVQVEFSHGDLRVWTERATLGEVLHAIGRQIGASVSIPPSAEQDPVVADLGPAPAREVLVSLLNGAPYNVVLLGSGRDLAQVTSIILTPRGSGLPDMPANYAPMPVQEPAPVPDVAPESDEPPPPPPDQDNPPDSEPQ